MLYLYQSNKVERLLAQLVALLLEQDVAPLEHETIVVENPGLAHWLKMQLANSLGIAANLEFPMPSRFFWQVQRQLMPDLAQESVFNKDSLTWLIVESLQNEALMEQEAFQLLQSYLRANDSDTASDTALKYYRLATTIADLYDQYLVYRPDWIEHWQDQAFEIEGEALTDHRWQGILWHHLIEKVKAKDLSDRHRGNMVTDFMAVLAQAGSGELPKRVIFFGFTTLPKHQIDALQLLSQKMDVHLLTPNPCQFYWGDVMSETVQAKLRARNIQLPMADAGNDLLASLGKLGQDFQRLLLEVPDIQEQSLFLESGAHNLLEHIQDQILNLQQPSDAIVLGDIDDSIQIVGCHSPMREIEVLHDHLLHVFENTTVAPQDVVVMIPDVASYAPFIDAVFNSQAFNTRIPYSISDRPLQAEHPILNGFILLLGLPQSRLQFSDVITLLEIPAIYAAYDLAESDIPTLKQWLIDAGVRWGFDGESRAQIGLPNWQQNTWLYGFKRLLMGYAMNTSEAVYGIVPVPNVEGLDAALLGPLMAFVNHLHAFSVEAKNARKPEQWTPFIHDWLQRFFAPSDEELNVLEHVNVALENWVQGIQAVKFDQDIEHTVFADGLKVRLQQANGSQHFMVGKVNFCTLLPMRSIPFKVVAVLGLNDSEYPRSVIPNSLDLMRFKHRLGDRSRRNEDRYLFLEAILSARESLWLSYKSKNQNNDEAMTPSVVLAELLDYLSDGKASQNNEANNTAPQNLIKQHPLQPFNPIYYQKESRFFSFNQDWLGAIEETNNSALSDSAIKDMVQPEHSNAQLNDDILLEQLIQFYQNPARFYLNQQLDISLYQYTEVVEDNEPFMLDGLTQFKIKQHVLQDHLYGSNTSKRAAEGELAFGEIGQQHWQGLERQLQSMLNAYAPYKTAKLSVPLEVSIHLDDAFPRLLGWQYKIFDQYHVVLVPSKLKAKHLIQLMLEQACLSAMGYQKHSRLICQDNMVSLLPMSADDAKQYLKNLMQIFLNATLKPLALLPETAWQLVAPLKKGARTSQQDKAQSVFEGSTGPFGVSGERDDLHVRRCFGDLTDIPQDTVNYAHDLFAIWVESELFEVETL
ncbi:exodeoxyribonuclease V subunit gamma [Pseudomonas sp. HK3]